MPAHYGLMGLGIMGSAMAANILDAGLTLTVHNRTPGKAEALKRAGAQAAAVPAELFDICDVLVLMVSDQQAVEDLLFGHGAEAFLAGKVVVNMGTVAPQYNKRLGERLGELGADFVEAPVSGSKGPAEQGELVILAGGRESTVAELAPLFDAVGKRTVYCGPVGRASTLKISLNMLLGVMMQGLTEMLDLGSKGGLTREAMLEVVLAGPLSNALFAMKQELLLDGEFPAQFPLKHMAKDLRLAVEAADGMGARIPLGRTARDQYVAADERGLGDEDFAAVSKSF